METKVALKTSLPSVEQVKEECSKTESILKDQIANLKKQIETLKLLGQGSSMRVKELEEQIKILNDNLVKEKARQCPQPVDNSSQIEELQTQLEEKSKQIMIFTNDLSSSEMQIRQLQRDVEKLEGFQMRHVLYILAGVGIGVSGFYAYNKYKS